jgi:hypothetical protein
MIFYLKRFFLFIFLCTFSVFVAVGQDSVFHFLQKINVPTASFSVNQLGELYVLTSGNQLKKYNAKGDSIGVFNQVTKYGKLATVEAENPWKTILFYQNFSTLVLLDKYLNVVTSIDLRKRNIFRVRAVTTSYDNNIWLFDEQDNKLKKIDDNGNLLLETVDFRLLFDTVPDPQKIIDRDGFVYLYDSLKGIYIFDYYGSFKSKLSFTHWTGIEVVGKTIYGFGTKNLYRYTFPLPDVTKIALPQEFANSSLIKLRNNMIYVLKNEQLRIYSVP